MAKRPATKPADIVLDTAKIDFSMQDFMKSAERLKELTKDCDPNDPDALVAALLKGLSVK